MRDMKAIETIYKGYRFRSRLEARWAVFFDALGYHWDYEREGFDLDGVWYLPDFWLQDIQCFAEVKPHALTFEEFNKASALSCVCLEGMPDARFYYHALPGHTGDHHEYGDYVAGLKQRGHWHRSVDWGWIELASSLHKKRPWYHYGEGIEVYQDPRTTRAIYAARAARFEHRTREGQ